MNKSKQMFLGYWLIEPLANHYIDRFDSVPDMTYNYSGIACEMIDLAIFIKGPARYLRATVRDYSTNGEQVPEKDEEIFNLVNLAEPIIRLCFNGEAKFYDHVVVAMYEADDQYIFEITPNTNDADQSANAKAFQEGMESVINSPNVAAIFRLFIDSFDASIPIQYRYLSLYKILELTLKSGDQWNYSQLEQCITMAGIEETKPVGISRSAKKWVHELRDKCAHIKKGSSFGATGLDSEAAVQVASAMPIINRLACVAMGSLASKLQTLTTGACLRYSILDSISGRTLVAPGF